jgi:hypothetical protein
VVLDSFRQMLGGNVRALIQVGDGAGNLQDAVVRSWFNSLKGTGMTSTCKSMRSSSGPLIRLMYFWTSPGWG